jgi:hypothetical protein
VPVILIDANIEGQGALIWMRMQAVDWREIAVGLDVTMQRFDDVGLESDATDDDVWRFCQEHGFYLLTSNRNAESEESLEVTIRREGAATSLPVFTLPLADRVYHSPSFLERVVEKILEFIADADNIRGTGRLYLP